MSKDFRFDKYVEDDQIETSKKYSPRVQRELHLKGQKKRQAGNRHADRNRDTWSHDNDKWAHV